ncbi:MAG: phosphoglycerate kinase [Candidatus Woesearchaeota archaeon]
MKLKRMQQLALKNKRIFLRVDFNVPLDDKRNITSDYRIRNALETINYLLSRKPKQLIIASHLGRPHGKPDRDLSMAPVAERLKHYLKKEVYLHKDFAEKVSEEHRIVLLENLRFDPGEKKGSIMFARKLALNADVYVNDAFGTAHRKDASVYKLPQLLPHGAGNLIEREIQEVHLNHKRPLIALFGAAKISDKLPVFKKLLKQVDKLMLGGGVVFTFMKAGGLQVGKSLVEEEMVETARQLMERYGDKIVFPVDVMVTGQSNLKKFTSMTVPERKKMIDIVAVEKIPAQRAAFDIGPKSVKLFSNIIRESKTVIWNGPPGLYEVKPFDTSTRKLAKTLAEEDVTTIVCGGDTAAALRQTPYKKNMDHISTGGGASLELLAGNKLPALQMLKK